MRDIDTTLHIVRKTKKIVALVVAGIIAIPLFAFIGGQLVKVLWNWLMPPLFGWPALTFWQALGLLALCRILFGGSGFLGSNRPRGKRFGPSDRMTPEERERVRERLRARGGDDQAAETAAALPEN
jgi:hypothetical protein